MLWFHGISSLNLLIIIFGYITHILSFITSDTKKWCIHRGSENCGVILSIHLLFHPWSYPYPILACLVVSCLVIQLWLLLINWRWLGLFIILKLSFHNLYAPIKPFLTIYSAILLLFFPIFRWFFCFADSWFHVSKLCQHNFL